MFRVGECPSPRSPGPSPNGKKLGVGELSKMVDFYFVFDKTVIHKYLWEDKVSAQFASIENRDKDASQLLHKGNCIIRG